MNSNYYALVKSEITTLVKLNAATKKQALAKIQSGEGERIKVIKECSKARVMLKRKEL